MLTKAHIIKVVLIAALVASITAGCSGKEDKQTVSGHPLSVEVSERQSGKRSAVEQETAPQGQSSSSEPQATANTPPSVTSLVLSPQHPAIGDKIKAKVETFDKEGDSVDVTYRWLKNGVPLSDTSDMLTLSTDFKKGDKLSLRVIPDDGKRKGTPVSANLVIAGAAPVINASGENFVFDNNVLTYQVRATHPEGLPLTYSLKSSPTGMTIHPSTGLIKWNVPTDFKGKVSFAVSVSDGHGGEASQNFVVDIKP